MNRSRCSPLILEHQKPPSVPSCLSDFLFYLLLCPSVMNITCVCVRERGLFTAAVRITDAIFNRNLTLNTRVSRPHWLSVWNCASLVFEQELDTGVKNINETGSKTGRRMRGRGSGIRKYRLMWWRFGVCDLSRWLMNWFWRAWKRRWRCLFITSLIFCSCVLEDGSCAIFIRTLITPFINPVTIY